MNTLYIDLYSDMIRKIKCGSYQGHKVKAKPILLYSILKMIEDGVIIDNRIFFNKSSEEFYKKVFMSLDEVITPFFKPFYYLQFDGFWHLKGKTSVVNTDKPSAKYIRENIDYAFLDNAFWDLLQETNVCEHFKSIIELHHLK